MRRALALASLLAASCAGDDPYAVYPAASCARVSLIDAEGGGAVFGAEDLALDAAGGRIFISAYDRRATERAAGARDAAIPEGGVYVAAVAAILEGGALSVSPLIARSGIEGGLRPHGIAFDAQTGALDIINRAYARGHGGWRMTPHLITLEPDGALTGAAAPLPCAANDVVRRDGAPVYSYDHKTCGAGAIFENIAGGGGTGVATLDGVVVFDGARFANGLAALGENAVALAATRERAIYVIEGSMRRRIAIPAAPDNLSVSEDGAIIAATHRSLFRFGAQRRLGAGRAGSQVWRIAPDTGAATLLFEDRAGALFSGATAAVMTQDALVLGSPMEPGLLACRSQR